MWWLWWRFSGSDLCRSVFVVVWWCFRDGGGAVFLFWCFCGCSGFMVVWWCVFLVCRCLCGGIFVVAFLR